MLVRAAARSAGTPFSLLTTRRARTSAGADSIVTYHRIQDETAAAIHIGPPDLIVSDVNMDGMDGYELCRRVRSEPPLRKVPFLFISGHAPRPGIPEAADVYLVKPVPPTVLIARLHEMLQPRTLAVAQGQG